MINRQKQAVVRGYQARIDGVSIDKNYYATLSNKHSALAGHWEKGWLMAHLKMTTKPVAKPTKQKYQKFKINKQKQLAIYFSCLLYTSDAADE